jgi:hypothetical protein
MSSAVVCACPGKYSKANTRIGIRLKDRLIGYEIDLNA